MTMAETAGARRVLSLFGRLPRWPLALWALLAIGGLVARPPIMPVETPLLAVAWQSWLAGSLLPIATDTAAAPQPPLLYWLIQLGWWLFGVSELWARLVAPLFGLGTLLLIGPVARRLWPEWPAVAAFAAMALIGVGGFAAYVGLTLLDMPLAFCTLLGLHGLALAWRRRPVAGWLLFGLALGLGFLAKGTVALALLLPTALLAPLWHARRSAGGWVGWYAGLLAGLAVGGSIALVWLLPAVAAAGTGVVGAILLDTVAPTGTIRPWYWLPAVLPLVFYPWLWWRTLWRAARRQLRRRPDDDGVRLCLIAAAAALAATLTFGSRQAHTLLPVMPALALVAGRMLIADSGRPKDFHAVIPALLTLLVGLVFFLLNIVPVAHLDAVWRRLVDDRSLPIWFGGSSLISGLMLLGGGLLLAQMTPRELFSRTVQLALLPALMLTALNLEFLIRLRAFFDPAPVAQQIHALQEAGRPVGILGHYHGEFDFAGRLTQPLVPFPAATIALDWARANADGVVVSYVKGSLLHLPAQPLYLGPVGDSWAALWPAATIDETAGAVLQARF